MYNNRVHNIIKKHHPVRHYKSLKYAVRGLGHVIINEANFRVQLVIVTLAVFMGLHFRINSTEWAILVISLGMLLSAEVLNTVVEEFMDNFVKEESFEAGIIKDLAAGFVLVSAFTVLIILGILFGHELIQFFS